MDFVLRVINTYLKFETRKVGKDKFNACAYYTCDGSY